MLSVKTFQHRPKRRTLQRALVSGLLILSVLTACFVLRTQISHTYKLATSHYPEPYTELYFAHSTQLPTRVTAGRQYAYTIHLGNHTAEARSYKITATVVIPHEKTAVTTATLQLKPGENAEKQLRFVVPKVQETAVITVTLSGEDQFIQFRSQS